MDKVPPKNSCYNQTAILLNNPMTINGRIFDTRSNSSNFIDSWNGFHDQISTPGDLVSLAWLQKGDILQIAPLDEEDESEYCADVNSVIKREVEVTQDQRSIEEPKEEPEPTIEETPCLPRHFVNAHFLGNPQAECAIDRFYDIEPASISSTLHSHGLTKPSYSYTHLIFMAIESTPQKCMTVNQIYNWCESNFPFYKHAGAGWKNSLRHNLSINKSFKRLPRDSRGPGRGAFWTVEPRERPTLLDAIKRNPWNFNSSIASNPDLFGHPCVAPGNLSLRRFGLTRSAPSQLLRSEGLGSADFQTIPMEKLGRLVGPAGGTFRILYTADGRVIASCDDSNAHLDNSSFSGSFNDSDNFRVNGLTSDSRYWLSPSGETTSTEGATAEIEWPAEEEEKYQNTLRLLTECEESETADSGSPKPNCDSNQPRLTEALTGNNNVYSTLEDSKSVTKQRRKSRLQPTRITDDVYNHSCNSMASDGKCNECKENTSGCEACQAKRFKSINGSFMGSVYKDCTLADIANALDSDQEHGPAGGPVAGCNITKNPKSNAANDTVINGNVRGQNPSKNSADIKSENESITEVYVTPAPYIDHEYSHCQAQLRRPEENIIVDVFNENYRAYKIKQIMCLHPFLKGSSTSKLLNMNMDDEFHGNDDFDYADNGDDDFSSQDPDDFSDEDQDFSDEMPSTNRRNEFSRFNVIQRRQKYRRGGCGSRSQGFRNLLNRQKYKPLKSGLRGNRRRRGARLSGLSSSLGLNATRRSKRTIKAPKRPYDDFEGTMNPDIDGFDVEYDSDMMNDRYHTYLGKMDSSRYDRFNHMKYEDSLDNNKGEDEYFEKKLSSSGNSPNIDITSRHRRRGRKRGLGSRTHSLRTHKNASKNHFDLEEGNSGSSTEDEEANYLMSAARKQKRSGRGSAYVNFPMHSFSRSSFRHKVYDDLDIGSVSVKDYRLLKGTANKFGFSSCNSWSSHTWSKLGMNKVNSATNRTSTKDVQNIEAENYEDEDEEDIEDNDVPKAGEHTTVEAAHLLLGISQMQSFRRQSGYLSLDSSDASSALATAAISSENESSPDDPMKTDKRSRINGQTVPVS